MRAGLLRDRVTIQQRTGATTPSGQPLPEDDGWTDLATVWAWVRDVSGREVIAAGAVQPAASKKVTIRYRTDLTAGMRLKHGAKVYRIESPPLDQDGRKRELLLLCSERVTQ